MPDQSSVCLYRLPENLIRAEFEARLRLQRTLHSCTALEMAIMQNPDIDMMKVVMKSLLTSLRKDLPDFMTARRDCRRHVLQNATNRHDPKRLIKASLWGDQLFE